jgi:membrane-bound ClpP family serine protease
MEIDELKIKNLGFIFIAIGIVLLLLSIYYVKSELFQYISVAILIFGVLLLNYKKLLGLYRKGKLE